jgi:hypothetical protein
MSCYHPSALPLGEAAAPPLAVGAFMSWTGAGSVRPASVQGLKSAPNPCWASNARLRSRQSGGEDDCMVDYSGVSTQWATEEFESLPAASSSLGSPNVGSAEPEFEFNWKDVTDSEGSLPADPVHSADRQDAPKICSAQLHHENASHVHMLRAKSGPWTTSSWPHRAMVRSASLAQARCVAGVLNLHELALDADVSQPPAFQPPSETSCPDQSYTNSLDSCSMESCLGRSRSFSVGSAPASAVRPPPRCERKPSLPLSEAEMIEEIASSITGEPLVEGATGSVDRLTGVLQTFFHVQRKALVISNCVSRLTHMDYATGKGRKCVFDRALAGTSSPLSSTKLAGENLCLPTSHEREALDVLLLPHLRPEPKEAPSPSVLPILAELSCEQSSVLSADSPETADFRGKVLVQTPSRDFIMTAPPPPIQRFASLPPICPEDDTLIQDDAWCNFRPSSPSSTVNYP